MKSNIDFSLATSSQIEVFLCTEIAQIRVSRNLSQELLAIEAGVAIKTIGRLERGEGVSFDTFIRVMKALGLADNLKTLLPDPAIRPMELINNRVDERKRSRKRQSTPPSTNWNWNDKKGESK